jgi:hypothetical protein
MVLSFQNPIRECHKVPNVFCSPKCPRKSSISQKSSPSRSFTRGKWFLRRWYELVWIGLSIPTFPGFNCHYRRKRYLSSKSTIIESDDCHWKEYSPSPTRIKIRNNDFVVMSIIMLNNDHHFRRSSAYSHFDLGFFRVDSISAMVEYDWLVIWPFGLYHDEFQDFSWNWRTNVISKYLCVLNVSKTIWS